MVSGRVSVYSGVLLVEPPVFMLPALINIYLQCDNLQLPLDGALRSS